MVQLIILESNRHLNDSERAQINVALREALTLLDQNRNAYVLLPHGISLKQVVSSRSEITVIEAQQRGDLLSGPTISAFNIPGEEAHE